MHHILLVDDNVAITYLFENIFTLSNYRVSVVNDPFAALEIVRDDPIDGVVTDFSMPRMNGHELIQRLHQLQPGLPAIIVTGFANEALRVDGRIPVLNKPVNARELVQRMTNMLRDVETVKSMRGPENSDGRVS